MFIDNKYYAWYKQLVASKNRVLDCYTEKHHIIPRCMGGDDSVENLVVLTAREHYIAHLLLTKCTSSVYKQKMSYALWNMVNRDNGERTSSTNYSNVRTKHAKMLSENNSGSGNPMFGKQVSIETRQKISSKTKGGKRSIETRERISNANKGSNNPMFGIKKSEEFAGKFMKNFHFDYTEYSRQNWVLLSICCTLKDALALIIYYLLFKREDLDYLKKEYKNESTNN